MLAQPGMEIKGLTPTAGSRPTRRLPPGRDHLAPRGRASGRPPLVENGGDPGRAHPLQDRGSRARVPAAGTA
jgi:hypothetical protein